MAAEIWNVAGAVILALGGGSVIVLAMSSWLGKVWANRILEAEKTKYQEQFALLKSALDKKIHAHNVAATRIDTDRAQAIRGLYGSMIAWHEAATQIRAPNRLSERAVTEAIETYRIWANELRERSEALEKLSMDTALYLTDETYRLVAACGYPASMVSITFSQAVFENPPPDSRQHLARIEDARLVFEERYQEGFEPARTAVVSEFRKILNPTIDA